MPIPSPWVRLSDQFLKELSSHMVARVSQASLLCSSRSGVSMPSRSVLELMSELDSRGWIRQTSWTAKKTSIEPYCNGGEKVWYAKPHAVPFKHYLVALLCGAFAKVYHLQCKAYYQCLKIIGTECNLIPHQPAQYYKAMMRRHERFQGKKSRFQDEHYDDDGPNGADSDADEDAVDLQKIADAQKAAQKHALADGIVEVDDADTDAATNKPKRRKQAGQVKGFAESQAKNAKNAGKKIHSLLHAESDSGSGSGSDSSDGDSDGDSDDDSDSGSCKASLIIADDEDEAAHTLTVAQPSDSKPVNADAERSGDGNEPGLVNEQELGAVPVHVPAPVPGQRNIMIDEDDGLTLGLDSPSGPDLGSDHIEAPAPPHSNEGGGEDGDGDGDGGDFPAAPARPVAAEDPGVFRSKVRSSMGHQKICEVVLPLLLQVLRDPRWQGQDSRSVVREVLSRLLAWLLLILY